VRNVRNTDTGRINEEPDSTLDHERALESARWALERGVPFNAMIGLELAGLEGGRCTVRLPDAEKLKNHLGTQHAAALFAAGGAASGGALVGALGQRLAFLRPVVTEASIRYRRPARGPIAATGAVACPVAQIRQELQATGKSAFTIDVELTDDAGTIVAELSVRWQLTGTNS